MDIESYRKYWNRIDLEPSVSKSYCSRRPVAKPSSVKIKSQRPGHPEQRLKWLPQQAQALLLQNSTRRGLGLPRRWCLGPCRGVAPDTRIQLHDPTLSSPSLGEVAPDTEDSAVEALRGPFSSLPASSSNRFRAEQLLTDELNAPPEIPVTLFRSSKCWVTVNIPVGVTVWVNVGINKKLWLPYSRFDRDGPQSLN